jgi:hypothetical protein
MCGRLDPNVGTKKLQRLTGILLMKSITDYRGGNLCPF